MPDNAKSDRKYISQLTFRLKTCLSLRNAGLKGMLVLDMQSESENNDTGHGYLPAGFETDNFPQPPQYR